MTIIVLAPMALSSFEARFAREEQAGLVVDEERSALERAASMILEDHPMGIGPNSYVVVANVEGYNARAKVAWTSGSAHVHNVYWLVADESGYLGLFTFIILLSRPLIVAFRCGWRSRADYRGDLLLGFGVALLTVYLHSFYEWIFVMFQTQYMFAFSVGAVVGLAQQLGYWRQAPAYKVPITAMSMQARQQIRSN
jgi:O-antigen ligase